MNVRSKSIFLISCFVMIFFSNQSARAFDHTHSDWDRLLKKHVVVTKNGSASWVRYTEFKKDRSSLKQYLKALSAVTLQEFQTWTADQQLSFLINAYNAFTIELILTRYPDIESIWDTGSFIVKPWRKRFFRLLGHKRHLDDIEHNMIRQEGVYDDARIHFAVNCASIGCPALRNEAFVYHRLDRQLEDSLIRFLSDTSRNRFNPETNTLEVSKIFDWYEEDFSRKSMGHPSLKAFVASYAHLFSDQPKVLKQIKHKQIDISFLRYDWKLNDVKNMKGKK